MSYYVNSRSFGAITSSGGSATADADRRIQGRCYLVGFSLVPIYATSSTTYSVNTNGTIKLEDLNSARTTTSGTVVVQFPVVSQLQYPSITYCSLSDDDGGVLFENGIYLNDTTNLGGASNTDNPLKNYSLTIFYTGPEFSDYS